MLSNGDSQTPSAVCSIGTREEQLIAVRIVDLECVVAPSCFLRGNRAFDELTAKISESLRSQLDKQASSVSPRRVFAEDDLALSVIDLADLSCTVA